MYLYSSSFFGPSVVQGAASQLRGDCHEYSSHSWEAYLCSSIIKPSVPGALSLPLSHPRGRSPRQRPPTLPTCERQIHTSRLGERSNRFPSVRKREPLRVSGLFPESPPLFTQKGTQTPRRSGTISCPRGYFSLFFPEFRITEEGALRMSSGAGEG